MYRFVVISGCSGGGKSTLLAELARRGHAVFDEPGRRVVAEARRTGGAALPWVDMAAFARRAVTVALADRERAAATARDGSWIFFDRGLIDAAVALQHATGAPALDGPATEHRYNRRVFMAPPWPEIYASDDDRRHGLDAAVEEYERLLEVYPTLGYEIVPLPKAPVATRADFVLRALGV